jgi:hypothetical protein
MNARTVTPLTDDELEVRRAARIERALRDLDIDHGYSILLTFALECEIDQMRVTSTKFFRHV